MVTMVDTVEDSVELAAQMSRCPFTRVPKTPKEVLRRSCARGRCRRIVRRFCGRGRGALGEEIPTVLNLHREVEAPQVQDEERRR